MFEFERCTPENVGIESKGILDFIDAAERKGIEMHSMIILRHGKICVEGYWKPCCAGIKERLFSFSKALTSIAVGFAVQEGILNLDEKVTDIFREYMPEVISDHLKVCTLRHLLTMSGGHETEPETEPYEDWIRRFFAAPFVYAPGTRFAYNTAGTSVLGAAIKIKTGENVSEFLEKRLFEPLGIKECSCFKLRDGIELGGAGFKFHTEDMARFMQFIANGGSWDGKQLLNKAWIDAAASLQIDTSDAAANGVDWKAGYGYQFWMCSQNGVYRADGAFGQFGIVFPKQDAIVIIKSASWNPQLTLQLVWDYIMPAIKSASTVPTSIDSDRLTEKLSGLRLSTICSGKSMMADRFANRTYVNKDGMFGLRNLLGEIGMFGIQPTDHIKNIRFDFRKNPVILEVEQEQAGKTEIAIGVENEFVLTDYEDEKIAAVGCFRGTSTFDVKMRLMEHTTGTQLMFRFDEGKVDLYQDEAEGFSCTSVPFHFEEEDRG